MEFDTLSKNPMFIRQVLGTILALTSGATVSRGIGLRIQKQDSKHPVTATEINTYLDTTGLMEAEVQAVNQEYKSTLKSTTLKGFMKYSEEDFLVLKTIPKNMYAESAYAKAGQKGMGVLPPEAGIVGEIKPYNNETIRKALIAKQEIPQELSGKLTKSEYHTLLSAGTITVNGIDYNTDAVPKLFLARSSISGARTCFNTVFMISLPPKIYWTSPKPTVISPGSLGINTNTILE